jgi:regulatory protein
VKIKREDTFGRARDYAYRLLSYRRRSRREITDRLTAKGFSRETVEAVVDYLLKLNYINDSEFARTWIESRISAKPVGIFLLKEELKKKGINGGIIEEAIERGTGDYDEYKAAKDLFLSRWPGYSRIDKITARRRIYAYLRRRGFSSEVITKLMQKEIT